MIDNKKASSPMVTTIFLLIFALSLGFVLVNLDSYIPTYDRVCKGVYDVKIVNVRGEPRVCQAIDEDPANSSIQILIANEAPDSNVDGLHLTFIGNSDNPVYVLRDFETTIKPSGVVSKKYKFPKSIGNLQQVKISIYRKIVSRLELCQKYSMIVASVPECEY